MNRRSFLKRASGLVVAASCALFIPSERLEFGVPRALSTATLRQGQIQDLWNRQVEGYEATRQAALRQMGRVPMLMIEDNFGAVGMGLTRAGTRVMVDEATSERWIKHGVAVPDRGHPQYGQPMPEWTDPYATEQLVRMSTVSEQRWSTASPYNAAGDIALTLVAPLDPAYVEAPLMNQTWRDELKRLRAMAADDARRRLVVTESER